MREAVDLSKGKARAALVKLGLRGKFKESVVIFTLKNLGMSDRQNVEHSGTVTVNRPFEVVGVEPQRKRSHEA